MSALDSKNKPKPDEIFKYAYETRKLEIGLFWQRSLFFWGFIAAAFVAYAAISAQAVPDETVLLAVSCFGIVASVAWTLANRGSKYWQGAWEAKLETYEMDVLGIPLFSAEYSPTQKSWWGEWRYSVSRLTMALSDFTVFIWVFLVCKNIPNFGWPIVLTAPTLLLLVTALFVFVT